MQESTFYWLSYHNGPDLPGLFATEMVSSNRFATMRDCNDSIQGLSAAHLKAYSFIARFLGQGDGHSPLPLRDATSGELAHLDLDLENKM